ncbi:MAG: type III-B CRISPR module RAMP protein Cmr6 [Chloracidobacterium sp.]|nr:type III-B CRISPR module RAMP protein Cmr6 [Chloracidobacterium sp.]MDW8217858.1 type III-B CRISPR module RAMP protein Cmr6 [Acidobacteriota bacterium]
MSGKMLESRRKALRNLVAAGCTHSGLWFDRFLSAQRAEEGGGTGAATEAGDQPRTALVKEVAAMKSPALYAEFFTRWRAQLEAFGAQIREAEVTGRLIVGLGAESATETSIHLHRTYGVPVIPGSALKGLASAYAHQRLASDEWRKLTQAQAQGAAHRVMFGSMTDKAPAMGYVTFFDALWMPDSARGPLAADVMSVHHAAYYRGEHAPPADWDSPTVVPFLTATGKFLIALAGPEKWVDAAFELLDGALAEMGVGAKTTAGYGRMTLGKKPEPPPDPSLEAAEKIIEAVNSLRPNEVASQLQKKSEGWSALPDGSPGKLKAAQVIVEKARSWKGAKKQPWFQEILAYCDRYGKSS